MTVIDPVGERVWSFVGLSLHAIERPPRKQTYKICDKTWGYIYPLHIPASYSSPLYDKTKIFMLWALGKGVTLMTSPHSLYRFLS